MNTIVEILRPIAELCAYGAVASPAVVLVAVIVGMWARQSKLAPSLGTALFILAGLLCLTAALVFGGFMLNPPPRSDPNLAGAAPLFLYCFTGGPLSVLTAVITVIGAITLIRRKRNQRTSCSTVPSKAAPSASSLVR